jgi:hypothetical protein
MERSRVMFGRLRHWWYRTPTAHVRMIALAIVAVALLMPALLWLAA